MNHIYLFYDIIFYIQDILLTIRILYRSLKLKTINSNIELHVFFNLKSSINHRNLISLFRNNKLTISKFQIIKYIKIKRN